MPDSATSIEQQVFPPRPGFYSYRVGRLHFVPFMGTHGAVTLERQSGSEPFLFLDRDGALIFEPSDGKIDSLEKLTIVEAALPVLRRAYAGGFRCVIVSNQPGLGSPAFPLDDFIPPHVELMNRFERLGVHFEEAIFCPHTLAEACRCRKPSTYMLRKYFYRYSYTQSYTIGDRDSDLQLAENLGVSASHGLRVWRNGVHAKEVNGQSWPAIGRRLFYTAG